MFWSTTKFDAKNEPFIFLWKKEERKNMQFFNIPVQSRMLSVVVYSIIVVERNGCSTKHTRKHECAHNLYAHAKWTYNRAVSRAALSGCLLSLFCGSETKTNSSTCNSVSIVFNSFIVSFLYFFLPYLTHNMHL